jgi:hypothetical protein
MYGNLHVLLAEQQAISAGNSLNERSNSLRQFTGKRERSAGTV